MKNNTIKEVLSEMKENMLLLESGVRIPKGTERARILFHDDYDGIWSAIAMGLQLKKQGVKKIETDLLHDSDTEEEQKKKLNKKREGEVLVVVDFDRFKDYDYADSKIDVQTDHHHTDRPADSKNKSHKSVGKTQYASDALHISSTKAQGFLTGTDLKIITGIDSAKFGENLATNIYLQRELKKNDGPENKKMRLAIITSSILGQLIRSKASRNPGAIRSIVNDVIEQPSVINLYRSVKEHISLQKEQVKLLQAYKGKKGEGIDWESIEEYNKKAPKEMRISVTKEGSLRKGDGTGSKGAASEEELAKRNKEGQAKRDLEVDPKTGKKTLKSKNPGDADLAPWEYEKKYETFPKRIESGLWNKAKEELKDKKDQKNFMSLVAKRVNELKKEYRKNSEMPDDPKILRKTENISKSKDFKGNRYLAYEDEKIAANIRDFWKFFQMAMAPGYYEKFEKAAKAKGKDFKAEEINLVDLGKKALKMAKDEIFTKEELEKRGIDNPEKALTVLNKAFDTAHAKSGGHASITNIDLKPLYDVTADKYYQLEKKAKQLGGRENLPDDRKKKLNDLENKLKKKSQIYGKLMKDYKERVEELLTKAVQGRINKSKNELKSKLAEDIIKLSRE